MIAYLRQLPMFRSIPPDRLAGVQPIKLAAGEIVFQEGDEPDAVFILRSGLMKTFKYTRDDAVSMADFILPGRMFGMIALLDHQRFPVTAMAARRSDVLRIPAATFNALIHNFPEFRADVFRQVGEHLRNSQALRALMREPVDRRIAQILLHLHASMGGEIQLLRGDIAAMAGCTESTCVRTMIDFRDKGLIETGWKKIRVTAPEKLAALLG